MLEVALRALKLLLGTDFLSLQLFAAPPLETFSFGSCSYMT